MCVPMRFIAILLFASACSGSPDHVNAYTGEVCTPDSTYMPKPNKGNGGNDKCQGTGNGDNCDDLSSGKIDCIGDGNSGQGDDKKHNCMFPQPGCDENGCCDEDIVDDGGGDPDGGGTDGGDPDGGGTDGGDTGDTGDTDGDTGGDGGGDGGGDTDTPDEPVLT